MKQIEVNSTNLVLTLDCLESNMVFDPSLRALEGGKLHLPKVVTALKHLPPSKNGRSQSRDMEHNKQINTI